MKICKDCKHLGESPISGSIIYCTRPIGIDLVDGSIKTANNYCSSEREVGIINSAIFGYCGKLGRYFEKKDEE